MQRIKMQGLGHNSQCGVGRLCLGLIVDREFHEDNKWCSATTFHLVEELKRHFNCIYIQSRSDYERKLGYLDLLISMEPGWAAPVLELTRTPAICEKLSTIPSYIFYSDPHANKWRQDYFLKNRLDYVLSFYYYPFRRHFDKIPLSKLVHFPWAVPDHWIDDSPVRFNGQSKICCFGGSKSDAYALRNWCRTFAFVESASNSGVENKVMTDAEYIQWLGTQDAAIAAGSDAPEYKLTVPKYFEIAAAGCLLFAQETDDLPLLGFEHLKNCVIFNRSNFEILAREYLADREGYLGIRKAGRQLISQRHALAHRMSLLQEHIVAILHQKAAEHRKLRSPNSNSHGRISVDSVKAEPVLATAEQIDRRFEDWFSRICIDSILEHAHKSPLLWQGRSLEWEVCHEIMAYHEFCGGKLSIQQLLRLSNSRYELLDEIWPGEPLTKDKLERFHVQSAKILPWGHGVFVADHNVSERRRNWLRRVELLEMLQSLGVHSIVDYGAGGGHTTLLAKAMGFSRVIHHEYAVFNPYVSWRAGLIKGPVAGGCEQTFAASDAAEPLRLSERVQAVICTDVAEHVWDPEAMLEEIREALVPDGYLVWTAVFGQGISSHLHSHLHGLEEQLLKRHGFERVDELPTVYSGHSGLYKATSKASKRGTSSERPGPMLTAEPIRWTGARAVSIGLERDQWRAPRRLSEIQFDRLNKLLEHAYEKVPFYRRRFEELGIAPGDIRSMDDFRKIPVLKKADIQRHLDDMKATNYPIRELVRDATGGSTGQPLVFFRNPEAQVWTTEAAKRFRRWMGYQPQDKLALIWGADRDFPSTPPPNQRWLNSFNFSGQDIEAFVKELREWKPKAVRGYASSLYSVASYIKRNHLQAPHPEAIESAAEKLWPEQRALIEEVFGCKVFEVYGSREIPSLACECDAHTGLHVFSDIRLIEIIKDGVPAKPPKAGSIVVTDLVNYGMPFIRYEIGDVGVWWGDVCPCGRGLPLLKEVKGRIANTIQTPDGRHIHGEYFTHLFYHVEGIKAFQVWQKSLYDVQVAVQKDDRFSVAHIEELVAQMRAHLGHGVSVQWRTVDEIPPAPSGKTHFTISDIPIDFTTGSENESSPPQGLTDSTTLEGASACSATQRCTEVASFRVAPESAARPRILFIVDCPDWAHDFKTDNLIRVLGDSYDMHKSYKTNVTAEDINRADLVVVYYWKEFNDPNMRRLFDVFQRNKHKLLLGICSHCELQGRWRGEGLAVLRGLGQAIFVNNTLLYREFASVFAAPIFYTPNGVDTRFFTPGSKNVSRSLRVGWTGSLTNNRNVHGYYDFVVPAVNSVEGVELITAAREQKWQTPEQMREFYRSIDVYICASHSEGTPNPCLEAAACGVPLVTTRVGNMPELIEDGTNGLFIEHNIDDIADKLILLRDNPSLRQNLSKSILNSIQDWDWQYKAGNYREMFDTVLSAEAPQQRSTQAPQLAPRTCLRPQLSVVLTAHNRPELLEKTLAGFAKQTVPKEAFEVIVVDDGSKPPLKEIAERFCGRINMVYIYQANVGLAAARNNGIKAAKGQVVLFSDDDDVPGPELIAEHLCSHRENPDERIAVLGHLDWHADLEVTPLMRYITHEGGEYFGYDRMQDGRLYDVWKWWGGLISAKMSLLKSVEGPFDSRLRFGYEDTELACRLLNRDIKVLYNARARSYILRPVDFEGFWQRRYTQGKALHYVASVHPEIIIPRYHLQDAASRYHNEYAPFLEEWSSKVVTFEKLLKGQLCAQRTEINNYVKALCTVYRKCFEGYWLKGYVEQMETVEAGKMSLSRPVYTRYREGRHNAELDCNRPSMPSVTEPLRITFVNSNTPGFDIGSSNLRIFHILKILVAAGHKIDHLYFNRYQDDEKYKAAFDGTVNFINVLGTVNSFSDYLHFNKVEELDCVWITNLWSVDYLNLAIQLTQWLKRNRPQTKVVIDTMDFHYKKLIRKFNLSHEHENLLEAKYLLEAEQKLYPLADVVLTVTEVEKRDILENVSPNCNVSVIPNIHTISARGPDLQKRKHICFLGSFRINHNADAVRWFLKEVFPLIVEGAPEVEFHILGFNNEQFRAELEVNPNVKVIGYVQDAESAVAGYRLFVCPMIYGAGMKGKLGLAAAVGTPIVTTIIGAEGFGFVDGQHCFIADAPEEFARKCLHLLSDAPLWNQFSTEAKESVAEAFSIKAVSQKIHGLLRPATRVGSGQEATADSVKAPVSSDQSVPPQAGVRPKVSIITSCYNSARFLRQCLDSIRNQTMYQWELFLLDDGSTDDTRSIIEEYSRMDERIKSYSFKENQGPYVRRNFAIKRANSDYVVIQDADDIMSPAKLEILHHEIAKDEQLAVIGSFYRIFLDEFKGLQYTDRYEFWLQHNEIVDKFTSWQHAMSHGSAIIRRELFEQIGLYDENPFASDRFWFAKLGEYAKYYTDVKFKNIPEYLTLIRIHPGSQTQLVPTFDPRSKRMRYRRYCEFKLRKIRQKFETSPKTDIKNELRNCVCSDFLERFKDHIARWENEPLADNVIPELLLNSVTLFNQSFYVSCISMLNGIQVMMPDITERFRNYDLLRAIASFAIDMKEQSLAYLNREIQNHNNPAARQFISDYFEAPHSIRRSQTADSERQFQIDVQKWCAEHSDLYDLQMIDTTTVHETV